MILLALALAVEQPIAPAADPFRQPVTFRFKAADAPLFGPDEPAPLAGVSRWQIQIFDFDDRKVHYLQGAGRPQSERVAWDGADRNGRMLRDGFYTARLAWADAQGEQKLSEPVKLALLTPPGLNDVAGPQSRVLYTREGMMIRLAEELTFDPDQWQLRERAFPALQKIADFLARFPSHKLAVVGHADSTGEDAANRRLSLRRALSLARFLTERGVDAARILSEGRGSDEPIASEETAAGRELNRRVEIVLLKATVAPSL